MVSAYTAPDELLGAINSGHVNYYLVKPVSPDRVLKTVREAVETHRLLASVRRRMLGSPP